MGNCYLELYDFDLQQTHNIRANLSPGVSLRLTRQDKNIILQDRNTAYIYSIQKGKFVKERSISSCCKLLNFDDSYIAFFKNNRYGELARVYDSGSIIRSEHLPTYKYQKLIKSDSLIFLMGSFGYETDIYCFSQEDLIPIKRVNIPVDIHNINLLPTNSDFRIRYTLTSRTHTSLIARNFFNESESEIYELDKYFYKLLNSSTIGDEVYGFLPTAS